VRKGREGDKDQPFVVVVSIDAHYEIVGHREGTSIGYVFMVAILM